MLPSSVPDLTAQTDMDKRMLLTDEENSEKTEDKHCTMQNAGMHDRTNTQDTSTPSMLPSSTIDLTTQSDTDNKFELINEFIMEDNNKTMKQNYSTMQNAGMHDRTNTQGTSTPSMLPSSTTNLTTQPVMRYDEMQSLFEDISDEGMRYNHHTMQHINIYDRTEHDTPIPPMLPSSTIDLTTQSDTNNEFELINEFIMEDNNKTMKQNYSIMQNAGMHDRTNTRDTSTLSMLPSSTTNLTTQPVVLYDAMQSLFEDINDEEMRYNQHTMQHINMYDRTEHDTPIPPILPFSTNDLTMQSAYTSNYSTLNYQINNARSDIYSEQIPKNVVHEIYLDTVPHTPNNQYQLTTINKPHKAVVTSMVANDTNVTTDSSKASQIHNNYHIASMEQLVLNEPHTLAELNSYRHVSEKITTSMSALAISPCISVNERGKTDSDQHLFGNPKLQCPECKQFFKYQSRLEVHIRTHFDKRPFVCNDCNKRFKQKSHLKQHNIRTHSSERPYACTWPGCNQSFKLQSYLTQHIQTHNVDKPYTCKQCSKNFKTKKYLKMHEKTHTNERPYACTWPDCNKSCKRKSHLQRHIETHNVDNPYTCKQCSKNFKTKYNLRMHEKTHINERPYACPWTGCDKSFKLNSYFQQHFKTHNVDKQYMCKECQTKFKTKHNLDKHVKKMHKN